MEHFLPICGYVENEFLYLAGTGKRVAVSARGPLGNIPSMDYVPENSLSVIGTNVLNRLGFSVEINYQNVGEELKLTNTATGKVIFGKLIHDLLWITPVQLFDIAYRGGNHVEEELARVRNMGGDVSSVKQRRPKAHLWGCEDAYGFGVRRSLPMEKLLSLCCMMMQCPVDVWPQPVDGLEWFLIDTAASYMTVNLTRFCDMLNYNQKPTLTLGPRFENMQVEATGRLGKFRKLV